MDHIGLWFFFCGCAGISIIVWIFNWVCWMNQCCCCDFLHNPVNKRIAWWLSFSFLLGVLACCISAFVTVNRFGFALEGAWCAVDRIYYDSLYGQLKKSKQRWNGLKEVISIIENVTKKKKKKEEWFNNLENIDISPQSDGNKIKVIYSIKQIQSYCEYNKQKLSYMNNLILSLFSKK